VNGSHGTGLPAAAWSRLERLALLLLVISHGLGCSSPERGVPDTQTAVPAATPPGEQGAGGPGNAGWPDTDLAVFVFTHLDLTTFRNSTGGQRSPGDHSFSDLGIHPTQRSDSVAAHDGEEWRYSVHVLARRDFNGDGLEDVAICFTDAAQNGGSYNARSPLLLQLIGGRVIALSFEIDGMSEAETCQKAPP
jgi:hypothetical protein